jgi:glycosyltransferase involved in cell wall biosynthesis
VAVTLTPTAVARDSRTFKQATSMSRLGFASIVVEAIPSGFDRTTLPFELRHSGPASHTRASPPTSAPPPAERPRSRFGIAGDVLWRIAGRLRQLPRPARVLLRPASWWLLNAVWFATYLVRYVRTYVLGPLRTMPRASLYYLHAPYQFPAVYCVSRWHRVPFIYDAHDFYTRSHDLDANAHLWQRWVHAFEAWMERLSVRHALAVVTVSEGLAEEMNAAYHRRAVVIRNAHDARLESTPGQTLRERLGLGPDVFLVVITGQAKPGLALQQVCDALAELPPRVHIAFVGAGYDRLLAGRRASIADRLHFLPPVAPTEVVPFIRSADAALLPYFALTVNYENMLPNGLFSSLAAELPVLYPGLPEIVRLARRYEFGLQIDALDAKSMCAAIAALAADPALAARLRSGAQAAARDLNWEAEEQTLAALVDCVLGRRTHAPEVESTDVAARSRNAHG